MPVPSARYGEWSFSSLAGLLGRPFVCRAYPATFRRPRDSKKPGPVCCAKYTLSELIQAGRSHGRPVCSLPLQLVFNNSFFGSGPLGQARCRSRTKGCRCSASREGLMHLYSGFEQRCRSTTQARVQHGCFSPDSASKIIDATQSSEKSELGLTEAVLN